jgi:uncharacterized membrane protein
MMKSKTMERLMRFLITLLGVGVGALVTKILLQKCSRMLYSGISGFIVGSILIIFPGMAWNWELPVAVLLAGAGYFIAYRLSSVR